MSTERVRFGEYMVHLDTSEHTLRFDVYPLLDWSYSSIGSTGTSYIDKETEPDTRDIFEEGKCVKKLNGSFCWRGVWEGRLYFTDEEYWGEDIEKLSRLYNDHIVPWCEDFIKNGIVYLTNQKVVYLTRNRNDNGKGSDPTKAPHRSRSTRTP